jgi:hypothetical protein
MCGCSNFVNNDEKEFITQDELNRQFDFTGNRPSIIEVGEDPSFDFTGNRPSIIDIGDAPSFDFMGDLDGQTEFDYLTGKRNAKKDLRAQGLSRKDARQVVKGKITLDGQTKNTEIDPTTGLPVVDSKVVYGQGDWFNRNWVWLVVGVAVIGGGYYIYKKRN